MSVYIGKAASVVVFAVVATLSVVLLGSSDTSSLGPGLAVLFSLLGLALIWFADPLSEQTCFARGTVRPTPPALLTVMGWLFMVGYPAVMFFVLR